MKTKKLTQRKTKALQTKERLLNTALNLIAEEGYDHVSIQDLCLSVGVSTGAFYHHFTSKEDIIIEAYRRFDEHFETYANEHLSHMAPLEKIVESLLYQVNYAEQMGFETMQQFYRSQLQAGREFFISTNRKFPVILKQMILEAQHAGALSDEHSAAQIARHLIRFSRGMIYDWCAYNGSYDIVEETSQALTLFMVAFTNDSS